MARLTEEMVVARSKQSDLSSIRKLNCWGAELGDVSVLREMPNVEVLALSLNKIRTLVDFAWCQRLKELYVRKNDIRDLREIRHLRRLAHLTNLWLDENPCTSHPEYRMTVLRNLPQLEVLDNVAVHPDEVTEASRRGAHIPDSDEEDNDDCQAPNDTQEQQWREPSPEREPVREYDPADYREDRREIDRRDADIQRREYPQNERETNADYKDYNRDDRHDYNADYNNDRRDYNHRENGDRRGSNDRRDEWREPKEERRDIERLEQREQRETPREPPDWREYERRESASQPPSRGNAMTRSYMGAPSAVRSPEAPLRHSMSAQSMQECAVSGTNETEWHDTPRPEREARPSSCACAVMGARRGFTRRPVARNSNLLSAVLCLVKELDYPALEVVELAVRCRMDELANSHL